MANHPEMRLLNNHPIHKWEYADETEREAADGFVEEDLKNWALQLDDYTYWVLVDTTPTWMPVGGTPGGGGALNLIESHDASSSATLDFTLLDDTYNDYALKISGLIPASAGNNLIVRLASAATPTWDSGNNYRWSRNYLNTDGATGSVADGGATSNIQIGALLATTAGYSLGGMIYLFNLRTQSLVKSLQSDINQLISSDSKLYGITTKGWWLDTTHKAFGIRLLMSSGNIASGTVRLYGVADS